MTNFSDNITTGNPTALTSALASKSGVTYHRYHRFTGGAGGTQTGVFPVGTRNVDAKLWIRQQNAASAATVTRATLSAGGTNLIALTAFGSALGVLRATTAGLGVITNTASATAVLAGAATAELPYALTVVAASADTTGDFDIQLMFTRDNDQ